MKDIFTDIYLENKWMDEESVSGAGSTLAQTEAIRHWLPKVLTMLDVRSVLNIPCGDLHWWQSMDISDNIVVTHADVVPDIIESISDKGIVDNDKLKVLDIATDPLPKVDLIFTRDCLGHFDNDSVRLALDNMIASGSTYLLTTHFPDSKWPTNKNIKTGDWRPINLDKQFGLGLPLLSIYEQEQSAGGAYQDKTLSLWRLN